MNKTNKNQCTLEKKVSLSYKRLVFYYIQKNKIKSKNIYSVFVFINLLTADIQISIISVHKKKRTK